ncbi:hypothetical protein [Asticcacaulis sp.]|uniref:hypothetical protein n=1 Tax=Asticcacaulis sp. TaxID=1872648 RepID=UPI002CACD8D2|nr:hypothetical protein [Asticcacaulis sp.]HTM80820.1 hypothetical protein [Asticcacaulis sp.]
MSAPEAAPNDIRNLSYAEHFIVWVMRTAVACAPECRMIHREFSHAFGPHVEAGAKAFERVLLALAKGKRPITLSRPGHIHMTHDELSLLALFAAAQGGDEARALAHARWMVGQGRPEPLCEAVADLGVLLERNGRTFRRAPEVVPPEGCVGKSGRLHAVM